MNYEYTNPEDYGHTKFKLNRKQHKDILPNREFNVFTKVEAYYSDNRIELEYTTNLLGKIVVTLLLPYTLLKHGFSSVKDIAKEFVELFDEKGSGSYVSEVVWRKEGYESRFLELEEIYKKQIK